MLLRKGHYNYLKTNVNFFAVYHSVYFIWLYLKDTINNFKSGDPKENNDNYWMFSYDFKDSKDFNNYWDKNVQLINRKKEY